MSQNFKTKKSGDDSKKNSTYSSDNKSDINRNLEGNSSNGTQNQSYPPKEESQQIQDINDSPLKLSKSFIISIECVVFIFIMNSDLNFIWRSIALAVISLTYYILTLYIRKSSNSVTIFIERVILSFVIVTVTYYLYSVLVSYSYNSR